MDTTKEYDGYRMEFTTVSPPRITRADEEKKSSSESEEDEPQYYFDQFNLGYNNQADQDEDSEETASDEKEYSDEGSHEVEQHDDTKSETPQDKVMVNKNQPPRTERLDDESYEIYSDEESAEKQAGVIDKVKGIFSNGILASIGNFISGLTGNSKIRYEEGSEWC